MSDRRARAVLSAVPAEGCRRVGRRWWRGLLVGVGAIMALLSYVPRADAAVTLQQLTLAETGCSYFAPQLSGDGQSVVAVSLCQPRSTDEDGRQLVQLDRSSGRIQELTPPGAGATAPSMSDDGRRIVFMSNADLVPGQNPRRLDQVFLFDAGAQRYVQLSQANAVDPHHSVQSPRISGNGQTVVFASDADLVAGRNADGNLEIFMFDLKTERLHQVTETKPPAYHHRPLVSQDGREVVFAGFHPPFGRRLRPGVFQWSRNTGVITRIVEAPFPDSGVFVDLAMGGDAGRLAFSWKSDLLGENPDRNIELFTIEVATGLMRQITHSRGCATSHPSLTADGRRLLFTSNCPFGTLNPDRDTNVFLMRLDTGEVMQLTENGTVAVVEPPTMDRSGRLVVVSIGTELPGMVNPERRLQMALLTLPPLEPAGTMPPPPFLRAADVTDVLVSEHNPDDLYVTTAKAGILKSADGGRLWRLASFGLGDEHVTCLVEDPKQPDTLFAGTATAGIYKSTDGGMLWLSVTIGPSDSHILGLAIDPTDPDVVYADTPSGLFQSRDQGMQWDPLTGPASGQPKVEAARHAVLAGSVGQIAIGNTLRPVSKEQGRVLRLYRSGLQLISGEGGLQPVSTLQALSRVAIGPRGTPWILQTKEGVYRSNGPSGEWVRVSALPGGPDASIAFGAEGTLVAATPQGLYTSLDDGSHWAPIGDRPDVVTLMPAMSPSGMFVGALSNGTLALSRNGGSEWSPLDIPVPSADALHSVILEP